MSQKTIAVVRTADDTLFRVRSWADRGSSRTGYPKWPASIERWDGEQWRPTHDWELYEGKYEVPDDQVTLRWAIRRLRSIFDIEISEVLYEQTAYDSDPIKKHEVGWL